MFKLEIGDILNRAWEYASKNWLKLTGFNIIYFAVIAVLSVLLMPQEFFDAYYKYMSGSKVALQQITALSQEYSFQIQAITSLFTSIILVGIYNIYLNVARTGNEAEVINGFKLPLSTYIKCAAFLYITSLADSALSKVLYELPGFIHIIIYLAIAFVYIRCFFAIFIMIENPEVNPISAIKSSWNLLTGNAFNYIVIFVAGIFILALGLLACCIGITFTMVIQHFTVVVAYVALSEKRNPTLFDIEK